MDIDAILESGEWNGWRAAHLADPALLAAAARAWCASAHWDEHTPPLEDWKLVVEDLGGEGVSESALVEMAASDRRGLPFPDIPLFENEQVRDLCQIADGPETAAALVERLAAHGPLLTLDTGNIAVRCWEDAAPRARGGLVFATWQWMLGQGTALPSAEQAAALARGAGRRRTEAVHELGQLVRSTVESGGDVERALAVADGLELWSQDAFLEWGLRWYVQVQGPAALRQRLEAALEGSADRLPQDLALIARLAELGFPVQQGAAARLAEQLFAVPLDLRQWEPLEQVVHARLPGDGGPHPLAAIAEHLAQRDFSGGLEQEAWDKLWKVLKRFPVLMDVDGAHPEEPLPALLLAAAVRSERTIGQVALDLIPLAYGRRLQPEWWKALYAGLAPRPRRGGLGNAGDRWLTAVRVVRLYAPRLSRAEADAMQQGFTREGVYGRK